MERRPAMNMAETFKAEFEAEIPGVQPGKYEGQSGLCLAFFAKCHAMPDVSCCSCPGNLDTGRYAKYGDFKYSDDEALIVVANFPDRSWLLGELPFDKTRDRCEPWLKVMEPLGEPTVAERFVREHGKAFNEASDPWKELCNNCKKYGYEMLGCGYAGEYWVEYVSGEGTGTQMILYFEEDDSYAFVEAVHEYNDKLRFHIKP